MSTVRRGVVNYKLAKNNVEQPNGNYFEFFVQYIPAGLCLWRRLVEWNECVKMLDGLQRVRNK